MPEILSFVSSMLASLFASTIGRLFRLNRKSDGEDGQSRSTVSSSLRSAMCSYQGDFLTYILILANKHKELRLELSKGHPVKENIS